MLALPQPSDAPREAPVFNIKAVSRLTGIPADTLRRWESRYAVITPQRTEGGYRLYSRRDIETINWLKGKLDEGLSISRACEMLRHLGGDPARLAPQPATSPVQTVSPPELGVRSFAAFREELISAFRSVDEPRAAGLLTEALSLYSLEQVCLEILQPVLVEVGEEWERGEISVAVEHFASLFVRTRLSNMLQSSRYNDFGPLVLVGCAPEELHEIGPLFLAVFLRRAGFRVVYLGQNVPLESLQGMIEEMRPDVVCLSAASEESVAQLSGLPDSLDDLRTRQQHAPLLALGGSAFNKSPRAAERLGGLYLGEDAESVVRALTERFNLSRHASAG
jgi:DNA-binding transcriptional MerR regulator/methylmalonyl-CoA mutase cobalamin-binding subunit